MILIFKIHNLSQVEEGVLFERQDLGEERGVKNKNLENLGAMIKLSINHIKNNE